MNKFLCLVLPEAINCVLCEDKSFLDMLDTVTSYTLDVYPTMTIQDSLNKLIKDLRHCSLEVCVCVCVCVGVCVCMCVYVCVRESFCMKDGFLKD